MSALLQASYEIEAQYPKFVKGALACARESELLSDQLALTKAAENARKVRANQSKHGVIQVDQCRRMTFERKEEEEQLESDRQKKADRQQRKRWGPIFRELKRKIPYYIVNGSYGLSKR